MKACQMCSISRSSINSSTHCYSFIFKLFKITAICNYKKTNCCLKYALIIINVIGLILFTASLASIIYNLNSTKLITNATLMTTLFTFRCFLLLKVHNFESIAKYMSKLYLRTAFSYKLYMWTVVSIVINSVSILEYLLSDSNYFEFTDFIGLNVTNKAANILSECVLNLYFKLGLYEPISIFSMFYTLVCCQLRSEILKLNRNLKEKNLNFEVLIKKYDSIYNLVKGIDKHLSFFIFLFLFYECVGLYFMMSSFLHHREYSDTIVHIEMTFMTLYSVFMVSTITISASLVSEASTDLTLRSRVLPINSKNITFNQLRFQKLAKKEIYLTVWKIFVIKRSFVLGSLGGVVTYAILFYNLENDL